MATPLYKTPDIVRFALAAEMDCEPGDKFSYNNVAYSLISGLVKQVANQSLKDFADKNLFKPLGIEDFLWPEDTVGHSHAHGGIKLKPRDLLKIGELVLHQGAWQDKQLISKEFIASLFQPSDTNGYYSQGWWLLRENTPEKKVYGLYGDGWLGQYLLVLPDSKTVALRMRRDNNKDFDVKKYRFEEFITEVRKFITVKAP